MTLPGRLAFVDVETTGADPREDRITEIGVVLVDDGLVVEEWCTLLNPSREIPPGIQTLTGISNEMVARAPAFSGARPGPRGAPREPPSTWPTMHASTMPSCGTNSVASECPSRPACCAPCACRSSLPEHRHHNLDALIERFGLACEARHRALPDARVLVDLTQAFSAQLPAATLLAASEGVTLRPHLPVGLDAALLEDLPDAPGVYLLYDPQGAALFAGRASNLRTQVLAHWGDRGPRARELRAALQAGSLEWFTTAGPLGTALRQLRLIESHAPRHNRPPRVRNEAWAVHWDPAVDVVVLVDLQAEVGPASDLFGPFRRGAMRWRRCAAWAASTPYVRRFSGWSRAAAPVPPIRCSSARGCAPAGKAAWPTRCGWPRRSRAYGWRHGRSQDRSRSSKKTR